MGYKRLITYVILAVAALATVPSAQPESDIATPAEKAEITQSLPDLGQKEKDDWQRLREERKLARQQILTDIKANAKAEVKDFQQDFFQQKPKSNENWENSLNRGNSFKKEKEVKENPSEWNKRKPDYPPFENPRPDERFPYPRNF